MQNFKNDVRKRSDLDDAMEKVDRIVMRKYVPELHRSAVYVPSYDVLFGAHNEEEFKGQVAIPGSNVMLLKLERVVYDKDESILDKLTTAYNATALYESATLVMLIISDGSNIEIYYGTVCKKSDDSFAPQKQIQALKNNIESHFPGSQLKEVETNEERIRIVQGVFKNKVAIASVTGIAALKSKDKNENQNFIQGLEKLVDSLKEKECTVMVIADPVTDKVRESIRNGYEEIYSALKPFEKSEFTINRSSGKTITDSIIEGVTDTVNDSIAKTKTHTITKGTNSSHTVGGSVGFTSNVTTNVGGNLGIPFVGVSAGVSTTVGTSVSADYHYMHGSHEDKSDSEGSTLTEGKSQSLSKQNSIANALSTNDGEGLNITYENRSIKSMTDRIDAQIQRISNCEDFGMYDCGVYFLSPDYTTCLSTASTYKSIIQGEESSLEAAHINIWDSESAVSLVPYLSMFNHPIFDAAEKAEVEKLQVSASTLISGRELPMYMGLPKKSVRGIPVLSCAAFGRNVLYLGEKPVGSLFELGSIYHMHKEESERVHLHKNSMASHVFVTGSTGSGKSNLIYQIIDNLCHKTIKAESPVHYMVIEPAKGEYKRVFGGRKGTTVYGTNPNVSEILRINPFSFPEEIHILEHIDRLIEIFNVCWPMYAAMPAVLKESIEQAYVKTGWNLDDSVNHYTTNGEKIFPTFQDVLESIETVINSTKYSSNSKGDYVGALTMRVGSLTNGLNGQILTSDELPNEKLFDQNVIVDLSRIGSTETKALLMGLLILKLQEYRMVSSSENNSRLKHITILEEAHNLLKRTSSEQTADAANLLGKSVEMLANAIAEMRTYGEGFIIADQSPGLLDLSVIRNTNTKIIMRLPDFEDRQLVGRSANMKEEQIEELAKLKTGVGAIYQNNWVEPVLCAIDKWDESRSTSYTYSTRKTAAFESLKHRIVQFTLLPPQDRSPELIEEFIANVRKSQYIFKFKEMCFMFVQTNDVKELRVLRSKIIYEVFKPEYEMEMNLKFRKEISNWAMMMEKSLSPSLLEFTEEERRKILMLLTFEFDQMKSLPEYTELCKNLYEYFKMERNF